MATLIEAPIVGTGSHTQMEALVAEEVRQVEAFYGMYGSAMTVRDEFMSIREFVEAVYRSHADLITKWGGWRRHFDPMALERVPFEDVYRIAGEVGITRSVNIDCGQFQSKLWSGATDQIRYLTDRRIPIRKGQSVARKVLADVRERAPTSLPAWEKFFERMGQAWASSKPVAIALSCAPSDFLWLGCYGESTCYQPGGEHEHSKYNLVQIQNSIVLLAFNGAPPAELTAEVRRSIRGRMWGFLTPYGAVFNNIYKMEWETVSPAVQVALETEYGERLSVERGDSYERRADPMGALDGYAYVDSYVKQFSLSGRETATMKAAQEYVDTFADIGRVFNRDGRDDDDEDYTDDDDY